MTSRCECTRAFVSCTKFRANERNGSRERSLSLNSASWTSTLGKGLAAEPAGAAAELEPDALGVAAFAARAPAAVTTGGSLQPNRATASTSRLTDPIRPGRGRPALIGELRWRYHACRSGSP